MLIVAQAQAHAPSVSGLLAKVTFVGCWRLFGGSWSASCEIGSSSWGSQNAFLEWQHVCSMALMIRGTRLQGML